MLFRSLWGDSDPLFPSTRMGIGPTGGFVAAAYSPLVDTASVTARGARWDDTQQFEYFTEDTPAEQAAGQRLYFKTKPLRTYEMQTQFEGIRFDKAFTSGLKRAQHTLDITLAER